MKMEATARPSDVRKSLKISRRPRRPRRRTARVAAGTRMDRQVAEFERTFSVRWEW